mgnify:CR=1 FL=1
MNGIHCASENHCIAVAEGHNVPQPGTFIVVTRDGGKNWNVTRVGGPRDTLMDSRDIDGKEGWALGGGGSLGVVIGSENNGVSERFLSLFPSFHIPMFGNNSSMNVASALSATLFHLTGLNQ